MSAPTRRQGDADDSNESSSLKGTFSKDLSIMMYGFGDDETPLPETIDLVEDIVIEYAVGVLRKAMDIATLRGKAKPPLKGVGAVTAEDVMAVVRRDPKKYERVRELFDMQRELKEARAGFEMHEAKDAEALKFLVSLTEKKKKDAGGGGGDEDEEEGEEDG